MISNGTHTVGGNGGAALADTPILFPVTYNCNLNCIYCHEKRDKEINYWKSVDEIKKLPNEWVYITGGEPCLVEDIFEVCDDLRSNGKKVGLTTNGTTHKFDIATHVDRLGISLDGGKDLTDFNRGIGTFDLAVKFIKNVVGKAETVIMTTISAENKDRQMEEIRELNKELGCNHIQFTEVR